MSIDPQTRIGHVHLTVANLDRALAFYRDVLGFEVTTQYGREAVFLSAGGYHHHVALNTWAGEGAPAPAPGTTGLYHFAILYPDRKALAREIVLAPKLLATPTAHGLKVAQVIVRKDDLALVLRVVDRIVMADATSSPASIATATAASRRTKRLSG